MAHFSFIARRLGLAVAFFILPFCQLFGQEYLKVNLDCEGCDFNYIRQEIPYVTFVRDLGLADVQVFIRRLGNGGGGLTFTIKIRGLNDYAENVQTLEYKTTPQMTDDEIREGLLRYISVGLGSFLMRTELQHAVMLEVNHDVSQVDNQLEEDPWNRWVYEMRVEGDYESQSTQSSTEYEIGVNANRITEELKVRLGGELNFEENQFQQDNEADITTTQSRHFFFYNVVKSMGPHFSSGLLGGFNHNTFRNFEYQWDIGPAFEYSLFPYEEAIRREVIVMYRLMYQKRNYIETTLFNKTEESLWSNQLTLMSQYRQPWGYVFGMVRGSTFLHDFSKNRLELDTFISIRITQGLNLRISGRFERIRDQIELPGGDISLEDRLLAQRQIATDYQFRMGLGLSFTFGSAFNGVVNTRL